MIEGEREKKEKISFFSPSLSLSLSLESLYRHYNKKSIVVEEWDDHFSVILSYKRSIVILFDNLFDIIIIIKTIINIIINNIIINNIIIIITNGH